MEALWEAGEYSGRRLSVQDQTAVARELARLGVVKLTPSAVVETFDRLRVQRPSPTYAKAIASRVRTLTPRLTLLDVLLSYRQFAIRELSGQFGGKTKGHEEALR